MIPSGFNSRTREGCDILKGSELALLVKFQFTHPGGVRPTRASSFHQSFTFQFTHPGGVRLKSARPDLRVIWFQFTHPGGVRHHRSGHLYYPQKFQFTHPGGVRLSRCSRGVAVRGFQFTHPGGVRPCNGRNTFLPILFQFTHPGGVRLEQLFRAGILAGFQFTHPGGVRLSICKIFLHLGGFNSRTREGCDRRRSPTVGGLGAVSIHAPGRGATSYIRHSEEHNQVSIHAPGRGATFVASIIGVLLDWFQFTHPGGVRHGCCPTDVLLKLVSIHAPGRGAT